MSNVVKFPRVEEPPVKASEAETAQFRVSRIYAVLGATIVASVVALYLLLPLLD